MCVTDIAWIQTLTSCFVFDGIPQRMPNIRSAKFQQDYRSALAAISGKNSIPFVEDLKMEMRSAGAMTYHVLLQLTVILISKGQDVMSNVICGHF